MLLTLIPLLACFSPARAKSYRIERVDIVAQIQPDGSMVVEERRTYRFEGRFRWADYHLPIKGFTSVEDFSLRDVDTVYRPGASEERGRYQISKDDGEFYVKWFYRARNETRTFVLSYRVTNVLKVYPDVAELYYQFIGSGWNHATKHVRVTVKLPDGAEPDEIHAWAHGPLWGSVAIKDARTVQLNVSNLPKHRYWEGRILFPARIVPGLPVSSSVPQRYLIIREEARWAEEANQARIRAQEELAARNERWQRWSIILAAISMAGVLFWIRIYKQYGKAYPSAFTGKYYSDIPTDLPPALISYLLNHRMLSGSALVATIFDLARRGLLTIEEKKTVGKVLFWEKEKTEYVLTLHRGAAENDATVQPFEQELLDYLFDDLGEGRAQVSMSEIAKSRGKTVRWFNAWRKEVAKLAKEVGFYEEKSRKKMLTGLFPSFALIALGPIGFIWVGPGAVIPFVTGVTLLILTVATNRVARPYVEQYAQWRALRRYLRKYAFSAADRASVANNLSRYLIYGMVLGLSSRRIKELFRLVPDEQHATIFPWYAYQGSNASGHFGSAFGEAISSMVTVANSSFSSATGTGGGASAGGGAGGGGSGGGAG